MMNSLSNIKRNYSLLKSDAIKVRKIEGKKEIIFSFLRIIEL